MKETKMHVSEACHYYTKDGKPAYETVGQKGQMVKTTLAHAKKLNLFPSVTTVLSQIAKGGIENWRIDMYLKEIFNNPVLMENPSDFESWRGRVMASVEPKLNEGSSKGKEIHEAISKMLGGEPFDLKHKLICDNVNAKLQELLPGGAGGMSEASFCNVALGYAGCVDFRTDAAIVDFKTTSHKNFKGLVKQPYDEYGMQLTAYGKMFPTITEYANLIIDRDTGEVGVYHWTGFQVERCWTMFEHLLAFWKQKNGYYPENFTETAKEGVCLPF